AEANPPSLHRDIGSFYHCTYTRDICSFRQPPLPLDNDGKHDQILVSGIADTMFGSLPADMAGSRCQFLLFSVAYGLPVSGNDVINVIARLMSVHADRAAGMDPARYDLAFIAHVHPCRHFACAAVHPRNSYFFYFIKI